MDFFATDMNVADAGQDQVNRNSFMLGERRTVVPARSEILPRCEDVADPETGWATRNPGRAMAFLFVSPRQGAALDEVLAAN